jgi:hypothetical protein
MSIRTMAAAVGAGIIATGLITTGLVAAGPAAEARAVQLTGVQLRAALLPVSAFPAGFKIQPSSAMDSGKHLETAAAKFHLATMSCTSFSNNFSNKGFGESAVARNAADRAGATSGKFYLQQIYQFRTPAVASAFFNGVRAIAHRCPKFALSGASPGGKITTHAFNAAPIAGHRTFQVNQAAGGTGPFRLSLTFVFTVAGQDLFFDGTLGIGTAQPASPSPRAVMLKLLHRVRT